MAWLDKLANEMRRRQDAEPQETQVQLERDAAEDVAYAGRLVRSLLEQMNQALLAGHGSVWETHVRWGMRLWELWWGPTRTEGHYIVVTLLRDSRGTPYLKVQRRRMALRDSLLKRRLQEALRAAYLQPSVYAPRNHAVSSIQDLPDGSALGHGPSTNGNAEGGDVR
jgi:hypothetical protein